MHLSYMFLLQVQETIFHCSSPSYPAIVAVHILVHVRHVGIYCTTTSNLLNIQKMQLCFRFLFTAGKEIERKIYKPCFALF